jgi:putative endonuclease
MMANQWSHVLYVGVTNDLVRRVHEHKHGTEQSFTHRYNATNLVYFEEHAGPKEAIAREKQMKGWSRAKKVELIQMDNPGFDDLAAMWYSGDGPDSSVARALSE